MSSREDFESFIPGNKLIPELTIKSILVGVFLAIFLKSLAILKTFLMFSGFVSFEMFIPNSCTAINKTMKKKTQ